jgi:hypothetical protein
MKNSDILLITSLNSVASLYDIKNHEDIKIFKDCYQNDNYLIEPQLLYDSNGNIDRFAMGGEDGYVSIIDFDFWGHNIGRKGSLNSTGAWAANGGNNRLLVNSQGGLIDLLAVCDGRLAVSERSSNVVWKVDMDGGWGGEDSGEALVELGRNGVGSGEC